MSRLNRTYIYAFLLTIVSLAVHLALWNHPSSVVFDETHYGKFMMNYFLGTFFFDVHPPLANLLFALLGSVIGIAPSTDFGPIGTQMPSSIFLVRLIPQIAGILLPLVIFWLCRRLKMSPLASLLTGLLICFENSLLVQSRFIMPDVILLVFGFLGIVFYLHYQAHPANRSKRNVFVVLSAIFLTLSVSIKWSGLFFLLLVFLLELHRLSAVEKPSFIKLSKKISAFVGIYLVILAVIYVSIFAIHFSLLPKSGPGNAFMSPEFQKTLALNKYEADESITPKGFFGKFFELQGEMYDAHSHLSSGHPYTSEWYTWPLMTRSVFYWQSLAEPSSTVRSYIYYLGNPILYWLGILSILVLVARWIQLRLKHGIVIDDEHHAVFIILAGFCLTFLPYIFITRIMFLYHYEAALIMSIIAIGFLIDTLLKGKAKITAFVLLVAIAAILFFFFSPLSYGTPLDEQGLKQRMWIKSWR